MSSQTIEEAVRWRRHLHQHPELSSEELATSSFVAQTLSQLGLKISKPYGGTGLVATLSKGHSERAIAFRADMDALPIQELTGLPYCSTSSGKMHACGHDGHTAILLAAARELRDLDFNGTLHFVFQPAEEYGGGASRMLKDGLFRDFPVEAVFGLHNWPGLEVGKVVANDAAMMSAFGTFDIEIHGVGGHAAIPDQATDPIAAACAVGTALNTIPSRFLSPLDTAVVGITQIHSGESWNAIPASAMIRGTVRWFSEQVSDKLEHHITMLSETISRGYGCTAKVDYQRFYPATINKGPWPARVREALAMVPGVEAMQAPPSMASEDFSFYLQEMEGCFFWLGSAKRGENPGLHSPQYDFNDEVIPVGIDCWVSIARSILG